MSESLKHIAGVIGPDAMSTLVESTNKVAMASVSLGVTVTTDEILGIEAVKLAVLADMPIKMEEALDQLKQVESVAAKLRMKEDRNYAEAFHAQNMEGKSPAQKISYARANGLDKTNTPTPETMTDAEKRDVIDRLTGVAKLNMARRLGLAG